jgi:xanthine dehydrogenase YagR molybdenum-binding subunit
LWVAGGSGHTATAGWAIDAAGRNAVARLAELATADRNSPLFGAGNVGVVARAGRLHRKDDESRSESYAGILARARLAEIDGLGKGARDPAAVGNHALQAHGAVFAEVKVDPDFGQVRATRLVGAFAAGRIINPRLVCSQLYGGMIWGASFALHERASMDPRSGRIMNADLGEYHVAVNADVPSLEALLGPRGRRLRERARHQGRRRDRHYRDSGRHRKRRVARDRGKCSQAPCEDREHHGAHRRA